MSDRDQWMRRYINRHRVKFLEALMTELFMEGFPKLHKSTREKVSCTLTQRGSFHANSELLDGIIRTDDFPTLFIDFCEEYECNPKLSHIIQEGLAEYDRIHGGIRRRHSQGNDNQGSPRNGHQGHQTQGNDKTPEHEHHDVPKESNSSSQKTWDSQAFLIAMLSETNVSEARREEVSERQITAADESGGNGVNEVINEGDVCHETVEGVVGGTDSPLLNTETVEQCPCPVHLNREHAADHCESRNTICENNIQIHTHENENEKKIESTSQNKHNHKRPTEDPFYDPNNMDMHSLVKKTSCGIKMTVAPKIENNDAKSRDNFSANFERAAGTGSEVLHSKTDLDIPAEKQNASDADKNEITSQPQPVSQENAPPFESDYGSSASYYLTSSDEEELEPAPTHEIEDLKEPICQAVHFEETAQGSEREKLESENQQRTEPKEIQSNSPAEASEVKFNALSNPLSGIQCQEDIEKFKAGVSLTEGSRVRKPKKNKLLKSSVVKETSEYVASNIQTDTNRESNSDETCIFGGDGTVVKTIAGNNIVASPKSVQLHDESTYININEGTLSSADFDKTESEQTQHKEIKVATGMLNNITEQEPSNGSTSQTEFSNDYLSLKMEGEPVTFKDDKPDHSPNRNAETEEYFAEITDALCGQVGDSDSSRVNVLSMNCELQDIQSSTGSLEKHTSEFSIHREVNDNMTLYESYNTDQRETITLIGTPNNILIADGISHTANTNDIDDIVSRSDLPRPSQEGEVNGNTENINNDNSVIPDRTSINSGRSILSQYYIVIRDVILIHYFPELGWRI